VSAVTVTKFILGISNKNFIDCNRFLVFLTWFTLYTGKYLLKLKNPKFSLISLFHTSSVLFIPTYPVHVVGPVAQSV